MSPIHPRARGVPPHLIRDLDFLRDDHRAPIAYDDSRKGFRLTDPTFKLAPVQLTQREVFSFSIARKLLERFEGTPLEMDMRSVLDKIAESLRGTVSLDVESLTDQFTVLREDHVRVEPEVWQRAGRAINQRECLRLRYQRSMASPATTRWSLTTWWPTTATGTYWRSTQPPGAWRPSLYLAVAPSLGLVNTFPIPLASTRKLSSKMPLASATPTNLGKVRLLFAREVATYIRERMWHPSQNLRQRRNGALELRLQTFSRKELTRWILSWMPHVRVLAPRQLQDRVRQRLREGLACCGCSN